MITDEMLTAAAKELSRVMISAFPDPENEIHRFSFDFERKMKRLINRTKQSKRHIWAQRAAGFILAIFVGFMALVATSPSVRATVIGWIKEQYDSYIEYFFNDHLSGNIENEDEFSISILPETFSLSQRIESEGFCMIIYSNEKGRKINFIYSKDPEAGNMMVKTEDTMIISTHINEHEAEMYIPNDPSNATGIIWYDTEKNMMFYISAVCSSDTIIQMAESVK